MSILEFDITPRQEPPPLNPDRPDACFAIDMQIKRRSYQPDRIMRRLNIAFWALFAALGLALVSVAMAVAP